MTKEKKALMEGNIPFLKLISEKEENRQSPYFIGFLSPLSLNSKKLATENCLVVPHNEEIIEVD